MNEIFTENPASFEFVPRDESGVNTPHAEHGNVVIEVPVNNEPKTTGKEVSPLIIAPALAIGAIAAYKMVSFGARNKQRPSLQQRHSNLKVVK